jgi:hypothetical protein
MNSISNIWKSPKTSIAGVLIAVVSIGGVLTQQGITLGTVGRGTAVTLASALATALLGLLARDPLSESPTAGGGRTPSAAKLGTAALILLMLHSPYLSA